MRLTWNSRQAYAKGIVSNSRKGSALRCNALLCDLLCGKCDIGGAASSIFQDSLEPALVDDARGYWPCCGIDRITFNDCIAGVSPVVDGK